MSSGAFSSTESLPPTCASKISSSVMTTCGLASDDSPIRTRRSALLSRIGTATVIAGRRAQIRPSSVTALRSSASSAVDLSIRPRENSSISSPCTIDQLPSLVVTGNDEIRPSGTP